MVFGIIFPSKLQSDNAFNKDKTSNYMNARKIHKFEAEYTSIVGLHKNRLAGSLRRTSFATLVSPPYRPLLRRRQHGRLM